MDLLIKNCLAVDPVSGVKSSSVAVRDGTIVSVGKDIRLRKTREIDARGAYLLPAFIDNHSHADLSILHEKEHPSLKQGIFTLVTGNCGLGIFPYPGEEWFSLWKPVFGDYPHPRLSKGIRYRDLYGEAKAEVLPLIPYNTLRYAFFRGRERIDGSGKRKIFSFLKENLPLFRGLSLGLGYPPGSYMDKNELEQIFSIVSKKKKYVAVHIRDEGEGIIESLREVITPAVRAGCRLMISHFKTYGKNSWKKMPDAIEEVEKASRRIEIGFDLYPYDFGSTTLYSLLPQRIQRLGRDGVFRKIRRDEVKMDEPYVGWENILLIGAGKYDHRDIREIARTEGRNESAVFFSILLQTEGEAGMLIQAMDEKNVIELLKHPLSRLGSDSLFGRPRHPRTDAAFTRFLFHYVRQKKILSIVEATKKLSYNAA